MLNNEGRNRHLLVDICTFLASIMTRLQLKSVQKWVYVDKFGKLKIDQLSLFVT